MNPENTQMGSRRIQVRMPSGKIYGPYQRPEVLSFITAKKITGEEFILFEGTSEWQPIASDPEFFDAIQVAQFGEESPDSAEKANPPGQFSESQKSSVRPSAPPPAVNKKKKREPERSLPPEMLRLPAEELVVAKASVNPASSPLAAPAANPPPPKQLARKTSPLLLLVVLAGLGWMIFGRDSQNKTSPVSPGKQLFAPLQSELLYARPLSLLLANLKVAVPAAPDQVALSPTWALPEGLGAHIWADDIQRLANEENVEARLNASYWGRWAWDLMWLGETVAVFDRTQGANLRSEGERIFRKLEKLKVVPPAESLLFDSLPLIFEGKWEEAQTKLQPSKDNDLVAWFLEDLQWWLFWEKGASGNSPVAVKDTYSSTYLDLSSSIRTGLAAKDKDYPERIEELSHLDPRSPLLWFAGAEFYWRIQSDQVQRANGRFVMGASTFALLPKPYQRIFWKQYLDFLTTFGRQSTAQRAATNLEFFEKGKTPSGSSWWDLNQEGLDLPHIASDILGRASSGPIVESDMAGLQVAGWVMPQGDEALTSAGYHLAFEEDWVRALELFRGALQIKGDSVPALGGEIWSESALYKFDRAFAAFDKLGLSVSNTPESLKYNALIHMYGRDYDEAGRDFLQYQQAAPTDAWGHYFFALMGLRTEKNVNCAKSANLASVHGTGELKFRANLLYLKCRVLGGLGATQALEELKSLYAKSPRSIPLALTLTEAQMYLDLSSDALKVAEEALHRFPSSFRLRLRLGEVHERRKDYDKAVAFYSRAATQKRDSAEALVHIAHVYEIQEKPLEAATNYETAGYMNPDYPEAWIRAARAYAAAGREDQAVRLYIREIEARPSVLGSFVEAAEYMLKNNSPQEVPKIFQKYKQNYGDDPRVLTRLAQAYLALRELDNARVSAAAAAAKDTHLAEPHRILGAVFELQGIYASSKSEYERYLQLFPQAPDANNLRMKLSAPPFSN
ncbi:MAG: tetratricopeptide repeat protein [Bdellovibrionales bacterium]|nr:tetratricopeptide repeat protein [Bdellovibrionales bacterium]